MFDAVEESFIEQAEKFRQHGLIDAPATSKGSSSNRNSLPYARPLPPILVPDFTHLDAPLRLRIRQALHSPDGVAYLIVLNPDDPPTDRHPIHDMALQLASDLPTLLNPLPHPLENHRDIYARFGPPDGTVKVCDLRKDSLAGYREQGETAEMFHMHHDGLGSAGTVDTVFLYCDSPPLWGGFTFFHNILSLALRLADSDFDAFRSLFLPNAVTFLRPRGKGALSVTTPILYLNERSEPQSAFRTSSGEYQVHWRSSSPELDRARRFLEEHARPFAPGSTFVNFCRRGHSCLIRNAAVAHGRTEFIDGPRPRSSRCLARKWFMRSRTDSVYKHVPGVRIDPSYAQLFPDYFGPDVLSGEWNYDPDLRKNVRHR